MSQAISDRETALQHARELLQTCDKIVCFSGAGLSAESGISTFRDSDENALWSRYDPTQLASPEGFAADPKLVIDWYNWRRRIIADAAPNAAHQALAARSDIVQVTQNVDDLLERAGCKPEAVFHLHGHITHDRCHQRCGFQQKVDLANPPDLRSCPMCDAPLRPAVVWFGESLPQWAWQQSEQHCLAADCLLVIGTSASVYPAAGLIQLTKAQGGKVLVINTQASGASALADMELIGPCGEWLPALLS
ncbi:SIR2 family NAD-dependent protein deacylase [Ketobacter sp.]|uniref:SIR2 family NAD-dependent protein deacylase n=1 Tax=Ketobacter sp. TaxID=2083498 RepID=UPI000F175AFA|nr:Sir2 family NAD-dependent protein deacetylase [Ketobacter sp.]RLU00218.1 MAG: NAD-dependent protein deacylase [Ketobacter sp.]